MWCEQIPELKIVKAFNNLKKLLTEFPELDFDLCISDIEMPGIEGLTLASLLQNKMVIFTTAYKDYAAEAFDFNPSITLQNQLQKKVCKKLLQRLWSGSI